MKAKIIKVILLPAILSAVSNTAFAQTTAVDYYNRGNAEKAKGDLDGAIADYTRAIELDPRSADAYFNRGNAKKAKGDLDGATADYNRSRELGGFAP
jgi:tetratricopeptide (TPR) repeat protein